MKTAITEMFGIKYPIICGAMMWLCKPKLCAAVSNAGGMGNLTAGNYENEEEFREAIRETRKLTDRPFMVNVTILPSVHITRGASQDVPAGLRRGEGRGPGDIRHAAGQGGGEGVYRDAEKSRREALSQGGLGAPRGARGEDRLRRHLRGRHRGGRTSAERRRDHDGAHAAHRRDP